MTWMFFVWHILSFIFFCLLGLSIPLYPADLQTLEPSENAGEKLQVLEGIDKKLRQGGPFLFLNDILMNNL